MSFDCAVFSDSSWTQFLDRLQTFAEDHVRHRSLCDWITIFPQTSSRSFSLEKKSSLTSELVDSIGFNPLGTAVETFIYGALVQRNAQTHIEPCEWAQIQDEFKYNLKVSCQNAKFPFQSHFDTNSRSSFPMITDTEESKNDPDPCHVKIRNLVTTESSALNDIHSKLAGFLSQKDGATVLYHGTDRPRARNILTQGIYLRAHRQNRDFSCGSGFYLTRDLNAAVNWALSTTKKPAVLVFQVNWNDLDGNKRLDLNND